MLRWVVHAMCGTSSYFGWVAYVTEVHMYVQCRKKMCETYIMLIRSQFYVYVKYS
jgi:hypothetical protein